MPCARASPLCTTAPNRPLYQKGVGTGAHPHTLAWGRTCGRTLGPHLSTRMGPQPCFSQQLYIICCTHPPPKVQGRYLPANPFLVSRIHAFSDDSDQPVCYNGYRWFILGSVRRHELPGCSGLYQSTAPVHARQAGVLVDSGSGPPTEERSERTGVTRSRPSELARCGHESIEHNSRPNVEGR